VLWTVDSRQLTIIRSYQGSFSLLAKRG